MWTRSGNLRYDRTDGAYVAYVAYCGSKGHGVHWLAFGPLPAHEQVSTRPYESESAAMRLVDERYPLAPANQRWTQTALARWERPDRAYITWWGNSRRAAVEWIGYGPAPAFKSMGVIAGTEQTAMNVMDELVPMVAVKPGKTLEDDARGLESAVKSLQLANELAASVINERDKLKADYEKLRAEHDKAEPSMHRDQAQRLLDTAIGIILSEGMCITYGPNLINCCCQEPHNFMVKRMKDGWPDPDDKGSEWEWKPVKRTGK